MCVFVVREYATDVTGEVLANTMLGVYTSHELAAARAAKCTTWTPVIETFELDSDKGEV